MFSKFLATAIAACTVFVTACVRAQPPTDTGDPITSTTSSGSPTAPTPPASGTDAGLAYNPDLKALFASDCVVCHGNGRADGNYRMNTYAQVMTAVRAGSANCPLVLVTQPNGSMYRYFSGGSATRQSKATEVRSWVVTYNAQENR